MSKKNILLLISCDDDHDYEEAGRFLDELLDRSGFFDVEWVDDHASLHSDHLAQYDAVVMYTRSDELKKKAALELTEWVRSGGALIGLHCAADSYSRCREWRELLGTRAIDYSHAHRFEVTPSTADHFITRRMGPFIIEDELYELEGDGSRWTTLLEAHWQGKTMPLAYARQEGEGRVAYLALGHDMRAFRHPEFQKLLFRSIRWATGAAERPPVRCGVIGYGGSFNMGKTHAEGILASPGLEFVAACDTDAARVQTARADFPDIETFTSVPTLLKKKDLDLVVLVTPHNTHAELAEQSSRAGKHVVTEKPMCLSVSEADRMIAAARKAETMLSVFHNRRWDGDFRALKNIVAEGLIGDIFQVEIFGGGYAHPGWWWRSDKAISGGNLFDWGAHFVDWILNLIPGRVTSVSGHFHKHVWHGVTNEDHTVASIRFANRALATVEQSSIAAAAKDRWRVLGTFGAATMRDYSVPGWTVASHAGGVEWTGVVPFLPGDWGAYYRNVADHLTMGEELAVKPEQARRVINVIETAERSATARVELPLMGE